jgi:hypothetical protein
MAEPLYAEQDQTERIPTCWMEFYSTIVSDRATDEEWDAEVSRFLDAHGCTEDPRHG